MSDARTLAKALAFAGKFKPEKYDGLERFSALDWFIQLGVRRDCLEILELSKSDPGKYAELSALNRRVAEMLVYTPILTISGIIESGFELADFPSLFLSLTSSGRTGCDQAQSVHPVRYRDLQLLLTTMRLTVWKFFHKRLGPNIPESSIDKVVNEWSQGKHEIRFWDEQCDSFILDVGAQNRISRRQYHGFQ